MSKSQLAEFSQELAEEQARLVDPATLARAVFENVEAQTFCLWARLCICVSGRITPLLGSYLDERYPGFAQTVFVGTGNRAERPFVLAVAREMDRYSRLGTRNRRRLESRPGLLHRCQPRVQKGKRPLVENEASTGKRSAGRCPFVRVLAG